MSHGPSILAAFQSGESRMIFAARKSGEPGLFYLPDGSAAKHRHLARTELRCPVEDCPTPGFTTVDRSGTGGRDGFRHLHGNFQHAPESLFHLEAKGQMVRYLKEIAPTAQVEMEQASNRDRERIADVMVTFADGSRMAIEIQYSALTAEDWQVRHDSYRRQGIVDVWLFGHTGAQLRVGAGSGISLTPAQAAVLSAGDVPLWLNPLTMQIGVATTTQLMGSRKVETLAVEGGRFSSVPLADFMISNGRFSSDRVDRLASDTIRYEQFRIAERERQRVDAELKEKAAREEREYNAARREVMRAAWLSSASGKRLLQSFAGEVPVWLDSPVPVDIPLANVVWQWHLWQKRLAQANRAEWIRRGLAARELKSEFDLNLTDAEVMSMVTSWFTTLTEHKVLQRVRVKEVSRRPTIRYVKRSGPGLLPEVPRADAALPSLSTFIDSHSSPESGRRSSVDEVVVCKKCLKVVAEPYAQTGFHMRCTPGYSGH